MKLFKGKKKTIRDWFKAILIAFLIAVLLRVFFFQSVTITDQRMENTLVPGDHLLVNKLNLGARFPMTLLSIPLVGEKIPFTETNSWVSWIQIPFFRLPGFSDISRNDLIVFNYPREVDLPVDKRKVIVNRCIALPGDTIAIIDKKVFVNNGMVDNPAGVKFKYRIITNGADLTEDILKQFQLIDGGPSEVSYIYDYVMTPKMADSLTRQEYIKTVRPIKLVRGEQSQLYFPYSKYFPWNLDYYGPVEVPASGKSVKLNFRTIVLYEDLIRDYEGNQVEVKDSAVYINGKKDSVYTFKLDYYFVMDDNRDNAKDSRYWGFLPEDHIIGTPSFVWFSIAREKNDHSRVRWDRFLKGVD
jgi:signal peptidase I